MYDDLDQVRADLESRLARAATDRKGAMHTPVVVTGDVDARVMVLRAFDPSNRTLRFHTDVRAPKVAAIEAEHPGDFSKIHHLVKGDNYRKSFHETGDIESSVWSCGPVMALIDDVPTCQQLIEGMVSEAVDVLDGAQAMVER